jgi:hypothetical protein
MLVKKDHSSSTHNAIKEKALLNEIRIAQISSYCALIVTGVSTLIGFYGIILVLQGHIAIGTFTSIGSFLATNGFWKIASEANQRVDRHLQDDHKSRSPQFQIQQNCAKIVSESTIKTKLSKAMPAPDQQSLLPNAQTKDKALDPLVAHKPEDGVELAIEAPPQTQAAEHISFFDLSHEEITAVAQRATREAVEGLHKRGISTYSEENGVIIETRPSGEEVIVEAPLSEQ